MTQKPSKPPYQTVATADRGDDLIRTVRELNERGASVQALTWADTFYVLIVNEPVVDSAPSKAGDNAKAQGD